MSSLKNSNKSKDIKASVSSNVDADKSFTLPLKSRLRSNNTDETKQNKPPPSKKRVSFSTQPISTPKIIINKNVMGKSRKKPFSTLSSDKSVMTKDTKKVSDINSCEVTNLATKIDKTKNSNKVKVINDKTIKSPLSIQTHDASIQTTGPSHDTYQAIHTSTSINIDNKDNIVSDNTSVKQQTGSVECTSTTLQGLLHKFTQQENMIFQLQENLKALQSFIESNFTGNSIVNVQHIGLQPKKDYLNDFSCYILGDSHGRDLSEELALIMPKKCQAQGFFQPGAGFQGMADLHSQSPNLVSPTCGDSVFVLCGTNDVCTTSWEIIQSSLDILISKFQECKLFCIVGVPKRFDNKRMNHHIARFNTKVKRYVQTMCNNFYYLDPSKFLKTKEYNPDGVHLNRVGKSKLCARMKLVLDERYSRSDLDNAPIHSIPLHSSVPMSGETPTGEITLPKIACNDLIDLSEPSILIDNSQNESYFSSVVNHDTILFPEIMPNNVTLVDLDTNVPDNSEVTPRTPACYSSSSNNYYQLAHVSIDSFTNNAAFSSPIVPPTHSLNLTESTFGSQIPSNFHPAGQPKAT